jgi:hypothetical protein
MRTEKALKEALAKFNLKRAMDLSDKIQAYEEKGGILSNTESLLLEQLSDKIMSADSP